jgi:4-hydroxythreonine-4-phosphate dehydrogenase
MDINLEKPVVGISLGDLNGIGPEIVVRSLGDPKILDICTPVVFGSQRSMNFFKKALHEAHFNFQTVADTSKIVRQQINVVSCWEEDVEITPGQLNETGGKYGYLSLQAAAEALRDQHIDVLVTAPIHKQNIQSEAFQHNGHTPYLKEVFQLNDVLMFMVAENIKVALVTEHVPVKEVSAHLTKEKIVGKLKLMHQSLQKDFGFNKPKVAVLALNPHAGDEGLIGTEEKEIIAPAIKEARRHMLAFGPYPADAFFARGLHEQFDAVLAMYHDQGLIPFKSLAVGEGINFTAGMPAIRTSPDHGTAFDIAGKGIADHSSFLAALFEGIDIWRRRNGYVAARRNPLRKISARVLANVEDEKIVEEHPKP